MRANHTQKNSRPIARPLQRLHASSDSRSCPHAHTRTRANTRPPIRTCAPIHARANTRAQTGARPRPLEHIKLEAIPTMPIREKRNCPPVSRKPGQLVRVWTVSEKPGIARRKLSKRNACWRLLFDTFRHSPGEDNIFSVR